MVDQISRIPIPLGFGAYAGRSASINPQVCQNMFLERDKRGGKTAEALVGTPGLTVFTELPDALSVTVSPAASGDDTCLQGGSFYGSQTVLYNGWTGSADQHVSLRFPSVAVANGATIYSAVLHVTAYGAAGKLESKIRINEVDNAVAPASAGDWITIVTSDESVDWQEGSGGAWVADTEYEIADVRELVQLIVNRAGWASGQAMQLFLLNENDDAAVNNTRSFYSYDYDGGSAKAALIINHGGLAVRGLHALGSTLFAVIGPKLYSITTAGVQTEEGTLDTSTGIVYFADNGSKVMLVDGTSGYTFIGGSFAKIADADFPAGPTSVTWMDGYFIVTKASSGSFFWSALNDPTSWDALDYSTAEGAPDNARRILAIQRDLWILGDQTAEIWYNDGSPFARMPGAFIEKGLAAAASLAICDNAPFWLTSGRQVVRGSGHQAQVVSSPQIEWQIGQYATISDAVGFSYVFEGHEFYVLTFPTENQTWVFDVRENEWHERTSYNPGTEAYERWRPDCYVNFNDKHYFGDYDNGKIYQMDSGVYTDDSFPIRRLVRMPIVNEKRYLLAHHEIEFSFQAGTGTITLKWSDDAGGTYTAGATASLADPVIFRRLGQARERIYEWSTTAAVEIVLSAAHLYATRGVH